jgi:isoleucyl-tRNA synthetase
VVRDEELVSEGLVRDLARRLQALRKEKGYVPTDLLPKASIRGLDEEAARMVRQKEEKLLFLVRVKELEVSTEPAQGEGWKESEIDGRKVQLYI